MIDIFINSCMKIIRREVTGGLEPNEVRLKDVKMTQSNIIDLIKEYKEEYPLLDDMVDFVKILKKEYLADKLLVSTLLTGIECQKTAEGSLSKLAHFFPDSIKKESDIAEIFFTAAKEISIYNFIELTKEFPVEVSHNSVIYNAVVDMVDKCENSFSWNKVCKGIEFPKEGDKLSSLFCSIKFNGKAETFEALKLLSPRKRISTKFNNAEKAENAIA